MTIRIWLILLLAIAAPAGAEWGRLFYTPEQRAALDRGIAPCSQAQSPIVPVDTSVRRFDGEIRRDGGRALHWVDGMPESAPPPKGIKPGESWQPATGQVYPAGRANP